MFGNNFSYFSPLKGESSYSGKSEWRQGENSALPRVLTVGLAMTGDFLMRVLGGVTTWGQEG
jgi:hypothetical protein